MTDSQVWLITGASSGFGKLVTEAVLENGGSAIATLRKPDALAELASRYPPERLAVVQLDVSKSAEIHAAFLEARARFGRIDVVFNNAGFGLLSEAESAPEDLAREMFDVNFWGAVNVSKEAVRFFREVNKPQGGRLLQTSSSGGVQGLSALSYYCASKFALEGFTEGLAAELRPEWQIKVTSIVLGSFHTQAGRNMKRTSPHPAYVDADKPLARLHLYTKSAAYPEEAARIIYKLAALESPPQRFPLGPDAVDILRNKGQGMVDAAEQFASWSDTVHPVSVEEHRQKLMREAAGARQTN